MSKKSELLKAILRHDEPQTGKYKISVGDDHYRDVPNPDNINVNITCVNEATADTFLRLIQGR